MSFRSRRTVAVTALGAATALGLAIAPATNADVTSVPPPAAADAAFAPQLVTVNTPSRADKDRLNGLGLDLTEHAGRDYVEVVLHNAADEAALRDARFTWEVRIADLLARELERKQLDAAYAAAVENTALPSARDTYRMPEDYAADLDKLAAEYPEIVKKISIGKSVEGRDLAGVEIGVGVHGPEDGHPVFLMFGNHHAREWPSAEMPMEFAIDLAQSYAKGDRQVVDLLTRGRAIIVPVSNPDGFHASRTSGEYVDLRSLDDGGIVSILGTPGNAYKRKNCRYVDGQTQPAGTCIAPASPGGFGLGVDLNRNYGALWGGPGTESNPASPIYRGPAPFSEPETQAIRTLISTRQVTTLITNHTFSNLILRPVGVKPSTVAPDGELVGFAPDECFTDASGSDDGMQALGERMAAQNGYSNQFGWELYDTTGTTEDYSYNATGGYGYTFEIGPNEFHPPFEQVVAEYTGETDAAQAVTPENAHKLTTEAADECGGEHQHHDEVGGGNREAFLLAFENAVDAGTHSLITGVAPAGATLKLQRTGVFPLWDGSLVADTVATEMTVGETGSFEYHANPSTRPFVQSRKANVLGEPKDTLSTTGQAPAFGSSDTVFDVKADAGVLSATLTHTVPSGDDIIRNMDLVLLDAEGNELARTNEFAQVSVLTWAGKEGAGVPAGKYILRVKNTVGVVPSYSLEALTADIVPQHTARQFELWTMSCVTEQGVVGQQGVAVERGESVDVGDVCNAGVGGTDGGTDGKDKDKNKKPKKRDA
jgi:hypothetical protein